MRATLLLMAACLVGGCGGNNNSSDGGGGADMHVATDMTAGGDMTAVTPFNMPGKVFCYSGPLCSTSSAMPICCDSKGDGGFSDTCVATAAACVAMDAQAKTFACGQAADCGTGMVCCGDIGTSNSGKKFFSSTVCAASCTSTETQLCVTASECKTSGASCVGQTITGRNVGLCQ